MPTLKTVKWVNSTKLAIGIQSMLLSMPKDKQRYPVDLFESMVMASKGVDRADAKYVTERIVSTGIIRFDGHNFVL